MNLRISPGNSVYFALYFLRLILGANQFRIYLPSTLFILPFYHNTKKKKVNLFALITFYALKYFMCHTSFLLVNICLVYLPIHLFSISLFLMFRLCESLSFSYKDFYQIFSHTNFSLFTLIVITDPFRFISATLFCSTMLFLVCIFLFIMKHSKHKDQTLI